jgi:hypothetical protein
LDEYWVWSKLMRASANKASSRFFAVFAATIALLLAAAGPAWSEAPAEQAVTPVAEGAAPPPAEAEAPPVAEAQAPAPAPSPAPAPTSTPTTDPAADISSEAAQSPASAAAGAASVAQETASDVGEKVDRVTAAGGEVTATVDGATPSVGDRDPRPIVQEMAQKHRHAVEQLSQAGALAHGSSDSRVPATVEAQPPTPGIASGPGRDSFDMRVPPSPSPTAGQPAHRPIAAGDGLSPSLLAAPGDVPLPLFGQAAPIDLPAVVAATANATHSSSSPAPNHPTDRAPLNGPQPSPGSSGEAAPAPGGSSFVPLAALLALLALAAPAILRRLREVPDLPAPTLFVCALERPG